MSVTGGRLSDDHTEPDWVGQVLDYWFDELGEANWFTADHRLDADIRDRFLTLHRQISASQVSDLRTPRALLAAIIVLDQFSRNLFRGTASAYAADPLARQLSDTAIRHGYDLEMTVPQRQFIYMPFQHSEDPTDQARSVELFEQLGDKGWMKYALAHKSIIDRFGRFPHRNAILGRSSSAEEIALLNEPMGSF
jgi:uncharacterized protein (DUF924 family)